MPRGRIQEPEFRYYKFLRDDGASPYQGYKWPLPTRNEDGTWEPGEWVTFDMDPILCRGGLHFVRSDQHPNQWINKRLFEAEVDPESADIGSDKVAVKKARLIREIQTWDNASNAMVWRATPLPKGFASGFGKRWLDRKLAKWKKEKITPEIRYYLNNKARQEKLARKSRLNEARELHARASQIEGRITKERYDEILAEVLRERRRITNIWDQIYACRNVPVAVILAGSSIRKHWYTRIPKKEQEITHRLQVHDRRRRALGYERTLAAVKTELGDDRFFAKLTKSLY